MSKFHRFTDPTYSVAPASLPVGGDPPEVIEGVDYDRINVTDIGTGVGSATADTAKVGGSNAGTYFVAFGEDATQANVNRGFRALADNADTVDDWLHRDLAVPMCTDLIGPTLIPLATVTIPGPGVYLGNDAGYKLDLLFEIVDGQDREMFDTATGTRIAVNVVLGVGTGFSAGDVVLSIVPDIPQGSLYRIYYSQRRDLTVLADDAVSFVNSRSANQVSAEVQWMLQQIQAPVAQAHAWNAAPYSTIYDLAQAGLDERYNRATVARAVLDYPEPVRVQIDLDFDTPGAGGVIVRDGNALTVVSAKDAGYKDPFDASFVSWMLDPDTQPGSSGFMHRGVGALPSETSGYGASAFSFLATVSGYAASITGTPRTKILDSCSATVSAGPSAPDDAYVQLAVGNFFHDGTHTAVVLLLDMLELSYGDGSRRIVPISAIDPANPQLARVANSMGLLSGTPLPYGAATVRWIKHRFSVTDSYQGGAYGLPGMTFTSPHPLTDGDTSAVYGAREDGAFPSFYSGLDPIDEPTGAGLQGAAMSWGYSSALKTGGRVCDTGYLLNDGTVVARSLELNDMMGTQTSGKATIWAGNNQNLYIYSDDGTKTLYFGTDGSSLANPLNFKGSITANSKNSGSHVFNALNGSGVAITTLSLTQSVGSLTVQDAAGTVGGAGVLLTGQTGGLAGYEVSGGTPYATAGFTAVGNTKTATILTQDTAGTFPKTNHTQGTDNWLTKTSRTNGFIAADIFGSAASEYLKVRTYDSAGTKTAAVELYGSTGRILMEGAYVQFAARAVQTVHEITLTAFNNLDKHTQITLGTLVDVNYTGAPNGTATTKLILDNVGAIDGDVITVQLGRSGASTSYSMNIWAEGGGTAMVTLTDDSAVVGQNCASFRFKGTGWIVQMIGSSV